MLTQQIRLVLSHNQISRIPSKFAECTSLTYLNLRANRLAEFPKAVSAPKDLFRGSTKLIIGIPPSRSSDP